MQGLLVVFTLIEYTLLLHENENPKSKHISSSHNTYYKNNQGPFYQQLLDKNAAKSGHG